MRRYRTSVNPERLAKLAAELGLTVDSLNRLGVGWAFDRSAWAFPMKNADGVLLGVRLRTTTGKKFSVTGGHEGLFIPTDLSDAGPLLLCEGPTSCGALLDLGFSAIGRPSCMGGAGLVCNYLRRAARRDVIIFGDHDQAKHRPDGSVWHPGQDGAARLAQDVLPHARSVKVVVPPRVRRAAAAVPVLFEDVQGQAMDGPAPL